MNAYLVNLVSGDVQTISEWQTDAIEEAWDYLEAVNRGELLEVKDVACWSLSTADCCNLKKTYLFKTAEDRDEYHETYLDCCSDYDTGHGTLYEYFEKARDKYERKMIVNQIGELGAA